MKAAAQCEHCAYCLTGIEVSNFIAKCPECGRESDVRRWPKPDFPWWYLPRALGTGLCAWVLTALVASTIEYLLRPGTPPTGSGGLALICAATAATATVLMLRSWYATSWRHKYGAARTPLRAWVSLLGDWVFFAILQSILPVAIGWTIYWLLG